MSRHLPDLKRAVPTILSLVSVGGVIVTTILAIKASKKAETLKNKEEAKKGRVLTKTETVMTTAPVYIPTVLVGVSTVICILGANVLNKRQQAVLTSAYALTERIFHKYKNKIKNIYGEEAHRKILEELDAEECNIQHIHAPGLVGNSSLEFECEEKQYIFCLDFENRRFESTLSKVLEAEYHLNRNYALGGVIALNEFYRFLGLEETFFGSEFGWTMDSGIYWIDFNHVKTTLKDGSPCFHIEMPFGPNEHFRDDI